MDENRNFTLTVVLCMAIYLGWQYMTGGFAPPPPPPAASQAQPLAAGQAAGGGLATPPSTPGAAATLPPPVAAVHRAKPASVQPFATAQLSGQVRDGDAALTQLSLPAFAPRVLEGDSDEPAEGVALMPERPGASTSMGQAALQFSLPGGPVELHFVDAARLHLAGRSSDGTEVSVQLRPDPSSYAIDYTVALTNRSNVPQAVAAGLTLALAPLDALEAPDAAKSSSWSKYFGGGGRGTEKLRGLVQEGDKLVRTDFAKATKQSYASAKPASWAAIDEQYFLLAWVPEAAAKAKASLFTQQETLGLNITYEAAHLAPGASWQTQFRLFAGPKRDKEMAAVDPRLEGSIDYTFLGIPLGFIARPMVSLLRGLHALTHSWGVSILLLTLIVKLLLMPVVYKSMVSMRKMQELKPELDRLKARYAEDKERQQAEQIKLFRERGINPVSGCLPMLLQMPVWITLYRTLWGAVDLYRQPFLWLHDLTAREPVPYLALAVGAATFLQQKVTPVNVDPQQARMMLVLMPAMVTVFMVNLPSGLTVYMLANSVLTIVQQLVMHKRAATPTKA